MRILLVPRIEVVNGRGSLSVVPMTFVEYVLDFDPDARITIAASKEFGTDWLENYLPKRLLDRVDVLPLDLPVSAAGSARKVGFAIGHAVMPYLAPNCKKPMNLYDVVISNAFASNPTIVSCLHWQWRRATRRHVPLLAWSVWSATDAWKDEVSSKYDWIAEVTGAMVADRLVFESKKVEDDHRKCFRKMLGATAVMEVLQRAVTIPLGVKTERMLPRTARVGLPTAIWSGYWREDGPDVVEALKAAYGAGKLGRVLLQDVGGGIPKDELADLGTWAELMPPMKHAQYLEFLSQADVFVSLSNGPERTYGLRFGEMMAAGVLPVVHDEVAVTFLPGDYPYHAASGDGIKRMLFAALADERRSERVEELVKHVRAEHDARTNALRLYAEAKALSDEQRLSTPADLIGMAKDALEGMDSVSHEEVCKLVGEKMKTVRVLTNDAFVPPGVLRLAVLGAGFEDRGGAMPRYERTKP